MDILFDVDLQTSAGGGGGEASSSGSGGLYYQLTSADFSDPPTLAEVERLNQERWHTRPDWWINGTTPYNVTEDIGLLTAQGASYDAGANLITIPSNVTIGEIVGWDFAATETAIDLEGTVTLFEHNRMQSRTLTAIERVSWRTGGIPIVPCILMDTLGGVTPRIVTMRRNWFRTPGAFGPTAFLQGRPRDASNFPKIDLMEFNSFEGYTEDGVKTTWSGIRRYNYFDPARNVPEDASEWSGSATYNRGDVVFSSANDHYLRLCMQDGVTATPDWSEKNPDVHDPFHGTYDGVWAFIDPHSDTDTPFWTPQGETAEYYGNFFNRDQGRRRLASRQFNVGVVNAIRILPNNSSIQDVGIFDIHHNIFTDEVEARFSNQDAMDIANASSSYGGDAKTVEDNWYQAQLTSASGSHITVQNNTSGWTWPTAATVSDITAIHGQTSDTIAYQFTANKSGWMTIVVSTESAVMTARSILEATVAGSVLAKFEVDNEADVAALGFADLTLTSSQVVYIHALHQAGGGADNVLPVVTVTEGTGTSNTFSLTELDFDGYVFDRDGTAFAKVTLIGSGPAGNQVQIRGASAGGNTDWGKGFVASDGSWTATHYVPEAEWGNWYAPEARIGDDDGTKLTGTNTFGCGDVFGILGQSEPAYFLRTGTNFNQLTKELDAENLTVILADSDDGDDIVTARITSSNLASANVGTLALANAFNYIKPNRKLMVVDLAHQGTSPFALQDDSSTSRRWSTLAAIVAKARASGSDFGAIIQNWYNAPAASIDTMLADWSPLMMGQLASGAAFTLGNNNTEGATETGRVDHCLWDVEAATNERGRGLFARDRTKLHLMLPMPFNDVNTTSEDAAFDQSRRMSNPERAGILTFAADARVQTFLGAVGPGTHLADFDQEDTGTSLGIHPNRFDALGIPWFANQHLPAVLRAAGETVGEPQITGVTVVSAKIVDVTVDLPNGGNLTTLRSLLSIAAPGTEPPHYQDVVGFQISRVAGTKRPIFKTTETSYPSLYRGTVTIQDSGTGTAPNRTGTVRITLTDDIATGDQLTWLDGQANAVLLTSRDESAKLFQDMLMETIPAWRDTGSLYPLHGIPVRPQTAMAALTAFGA